MRFGALFHGMVCIASSVSLTHLGLSNPMSAPGLIRLGWIIESSFHPTVRLAVRVRTEPAMSANLIHSPAVSNNIWSLCYSCREYQTPPSGLVTWNFLEQIASRMSDRWYRRAESSRQRQSPLLHRQALRRRCVGSVLILK